MAVRSIVQAQPTAHGHPVNDPIDIRDRSRAGSDDDRRGPGCGNDPEEGRSTGIEALADPVL